MHNLARKKRLDMLIKPINHKFGFILPTNICIIPWLNVSMIHFLSKLVWVCICTDVPFINWGHKICKHFSIWIYIFVYSLFALTNVKFFVLIFHSKSKSKLVNNNHPQNKPEAEEITPGTRGDHTALYTLLTWPVSVISDWLWVKSHC